MLDAGSQTSYLWSTGQTTQTIVVDSAANYSVIVTGPNGCTNTDSIDVTLFIGVNEFGGGILVDKGSIALSMTRRPRFTMVMIIW